MTDHAVDTIVPRRVSPSRRRVIVKSIR